jgi:tRNA-specific 2-thiouridylase
VVLVGEQHAVYAGGLQAETVSWIVAPEAATFTATCKIRYRHQPVACQVQLLAGDSCEVTFDQPQKAVTPGQALVFYRGDEVLGGGRIERSLLTTLPK